MRRSIILTAMEALKPESKAVARPLRAAMIGMCPS